MGSVTEQSQPEMAGRTGEAAADAATAPLRVVIQQPALPAYRVPVFRALAQRAGIDLTVAYAGAQPSSPPGARPDGFRGEESRDYRFRLGPVLLKWHSAQWRYATPRDCDVLILAGDVHYLTLIPALLRARWAGVGTVLWGHGMSKRESTIRRTVRRRVARLATALLFYNRTAAQAHIDDGWDADRIFVAPNSLDDEPIRAARNHWKNRPDELAAFQREHGLEEGPVFLFVSRLLPENRADLLIDAAARLRGKHPNLRLIIIGAGPDRDRLEELVRERGLGDHVIFPGAIYDEMHLAPWFLSAEAFCYPTNMGLSVLHAFNYGLPVITGDDLQRHGPEIESLRDGENGLLFAHGDVVALAGAMDRIAADHALRDRLADESLRTVEREYNLKKMVDGFEQAIRYAAGQRATR